MVGGSGAPQRLKQVSLWCAITIGVLVLVGGASILISGLLIHAVETLDGGRRVASQRGQIGDYFGAVGAVFSGLALLALVVTLLLQQKELRVQRAELAEQRDELARSRAELGRSAQSDLRALHLELTKLAMQDPSLAAVWNDYPGLGHAEQRQFLFANLVYQHIYLASKWDDVTDDELLVHARDMMRSEPFRRYWLASRDLKLSLPEGSDERRFALVFDAAFSSQPSPPAETRERGWRRFARRTPATR